MTNPCAHATQGKPGACRVQPLARMLRTASPGFGPGSAPHLDDKGPASNAAQALRLEQLADGKHGAAPGGGLPPQRAMQVHRLRWATRRPRGVSHGTQQNMLCSRQAGRQAGKQAGTAGELSSLGSSLGYDMQPLTLPVTMAGVKPAARENSSMNQPISRAPCVASRAEDGMLGTRGLHGLGPL